MECEGGLSGFKAFHDGWPRIAVFVERAAFLCRGPVSCPPGPVSPTTLTAGQHCISDDLIAGILLGVAELDTNEQELPFSSSEGSVAWFLQLCLCVTFSLVKCM